MSYIIVLLGIECANLLSYVESRDKTGITPEQRQWENNMHIHW